MVKQSKWTKTSADCLSLYYTYPGFPAVSQKTVFRTSTLKARLKGSRQPPLLSALFIYFFLIVLVEYPAKTETFFWNRHLYLT